MLTPRSEHFFQRLVQRIKRLCAARTFRRVVSQAIEKRKHMIAGDHLFNSVIHPAMPQQDVQRINLFLGLKRDSNGNEYRFI